MVTFSFFMTQVHDQGHTFMTIGLSIFLAKGARLAASSRLSPEFLFFHNAPEMSYVFNSTEDPTWRQVLSILCRGFSTSLFYVHAPASLPNSASRALGYVPLLTGTVLKATDDKGETGGESMISIQSVKASRIFTWKRVAEPKPTNGMSPIRTQG